MIASQPPALRALARIVDLRVRVGAVEKRARHREVELVAELEALLAASRRGAGADADVLLACALWLLNDGELAVPELHAIAVRDGHVLVEAMLADDAPHRGLARGGRLPENGIPETQRVLRHVRMQEPGYFNAAGAFVWEPTASDGPPMSWEDIKNFYSPCAQPTRECPGKYPWDAHAYPECERERRPSRECQGIPEPEPPEQHREPFTLRPMHPTFIRRQVKRLAQHQSPFTIGRLLDDPAIRLCDVIEIAARRPTTPAIVRQLTTRLEWMQRPEVRATLAMNPCTPTRAALILVATCRPRLRAIASRNVHPRVRELALLLSAGDAAADELALSPA